MSTEELKEFCKLEFEEFKFIDDIIQFTKEANQGPIRGLKDEDKKGRVRDYVSDNCNLENVYTEYVSQDKIDKLYELVFNIYNFVGSHSKFTHVAIV